MLASTESGSASAAARTLVGLRLVAEEAGDEIVDAARASRASRRAHFISEGVLCHDLRIATAIGSGKVESCRSSSTTGRASTTRSSATGKPLLLIAGTASDGASWAPLLPLAARPAADPDRQPRARARPRSRDRSTHGEMVDDCAALLDHLGLGAVDVVGHSLGGWIGLGLAAWHPDKVARLVTMGTRHASTPRTEVLFRDWRGSISPWCRRTGSGCSISGCFPTPSSPTRRTSRRPPMPRRPIEYRQSPGDFARQIAALDQSGSCRPVTRSPARCWRSPASSTCLAPPGGRGTSSIGRSPDHRRARRSPARRIPCIGRSRRKSRPRSTAFLGARSPGRHRPRAPRR